jgi:RNA recognition motif-containing protein
MFCLMIANQIKQSITRHPFCSFSAVLMPIKTLADHNPGRSRVKLFIGNLPYDITEPEVLKLFSTYGEVVNANLVIDHFSGRSKGFAFVEMATRSEGHRAMETLNKMEYRHRQLVCNEAKPQKKGKRRR